MVLIARAFTFCCGYSQFSALFFLRFPAAAGFAARSWFFVARENYLRRMLQSTMKLHTVLRVAPQPGFHGISASVRQCWLGRSCSTGWCSAAGCWHQPAKVAPEGSSLAASGRQSGPSMVFFLQLRHISPLGPLVVGIVAVFCLKCFQNSRIAFWEIWDPGIPS